MIGEARPTMNDVARTAGVSLKTVSRVVNGETTVAPDLAARVRAAVESLNYRPHIGASMLRRNDRRTRTIGVLLEDVGNPFSSALHRAIEDEARLHGVQVLTGSLDEDPQRERDLARAFAQRHADGLIVAPTGADQSYLGSFPDIPVVFVDRPGTGFAGDSVLATNVSGSQDAVRHLVAHGHRRIAYLGDHARIPTARDRHRGYLAALSAAGLTPVRRTPAAPFVLCGECDAGTVRPAGPPDRPVHQPEPDHHRRVPGAAPARPAAAGSRWSASTTSRSPTCSSRPSRWWPRIRSTMGRTAARALFERIDGATGPPREFWIPTTLIRARLRRDPAGTLRRALALQGSVRAPAADVRHPRPETRPRPARRRCGPRSTTADVVVHAGDWVDVPLLDALEPRGPDG